MRTAPVIPVLVIDDAAHARSIAEALVAGGLPVLEVTLRTAAALDAIAEMKKVPGAIVGAGTVVDVPGLNVQSRLALSSLSRRASPIIWVRQPQPKAYRSCPASPAQAISCAGLI